MSTIQPTCSSPDTPLAPPPLCVSPPSPSCASLSLTISTQEPLSGTPATSADTHRDAHTTHTPTHTATHTRTTSVACPTQADVSAIDVLCAPLVPPPLSPSCWMRNRIAPRVHQRRPPTGRATHHSSDINTCYQCKCAHTHAQHGVTCACTAALPPLSLPPTLTATAPYPDAEFTVLSESDLQSLLPSSTQLLSLPLTSASMPEPIRRALRATSKSGHLATRPQLG